MWANHPTVSLEHPEAGAVPIDIEIAPLIGTLWQQHIETTGSCQDDHGHVWLCFLTPDDAARFIQVLAFEADPDPDSVYERQTGVGAGGWEWTTWFEPQMPADPDFSLIIELRFPRSDLPTVLERLGVDEGAGESLDR